MGLAEAREDRRARRGARSDRPPSLSLDARIGCRVPAPHEGMLQFVRQLGEFCLLQPEPAALLALEAHTDGSSAGRDCLILSQCGSASARPVNRLRRGRWRSIFSGTSSTPSRINRQRPAVSSSLKTSAVNPPGCAASSQQHSASSSCLRIHVPFPRRHSRMTRPFTQPEQQRKPSAQRVGTALPRTRPALRSRASAPRR